MERLSIANIDTKKLINEIEKYDSVATLNKLSVELLGKYDSINDIKENVSDISIDNFKSVLQEVNNLATEINNIFKRELSL